MYNIGIMDKMETTIIGCSVLEYGNLTLHVVCRTEVMSRMDS